MLTSAQVRTSAQNRKLWYLANALRLEKEEVENIVLSFTNGRTSHTSELSFREARDLIECLERTLTPEKDTRRQEDEKMDRMRKRTIRAIFEYFETQGLQPNMEYVKGVACKATGKTYFNQLSMYDLRRVHAEFSKKAQVSQVAKEENFNISNN